MTDSLDVVHVCYGGLGGHRAVVSQIATAMGARGIRTGVVAVAADEVLDRTPIPGVDATTFVSLRRRADISSMREVVSLVRSARPAAVLAHTHRHGAAIGLSRLAGRRPRSLVVVDHTSTDDATMPATVNLVASTAFADAVVVLTEEARRRFVALRLPVVRRTPVHVIANGIDVSGYPVAPRGHRDPAVARLGMVARLVPLKDFDTLVSAVAMLDGTRRFELRIAGDGPERDRIASLVAGLGVADRVALVGAVAPADVPAFLRTLDVYVHSTHSETMSMAMLEAAATGIPMVASAVPGIAGLWRDGEDALLVPADDPGAMADAIVRVVDDEVLADRLAVAARARVVAEFTASAVADRYLQVLDGLDPSGPWRAALRTRS